MEIAMGNFISDNRIDLALATTQFASNTTDQNCAAIDMSGYEGVVFVLETNTMNASAVINVEWQHSTSGTANWDTVSTHADDDINLDSNDDDDMTVFELQRSAIIAEPLRRYVRIQLDKATAASSLHGGYYIRYGARRKPVTQDSDTVMGTAE